MRLAAAPAFVPERANPTARIRLLFYCLLLLTLVRGLLYLALVPPWEHYDEPTHFEYVRLVATRGRIPQPGDYDLDMRRAIASSMFASGFWKRIGEPALDFASDTPPEIGISELGHPPLYYVLLALPQLVVAHQSVEVQLYVARSVSVLLYVVVVAAAYGLVAELVPRRRGLALAVAAFIALLPPFTDLMSSVNNDVGAAAAASLLLWAVVRTGVRGPSLRRATAILLLMVVCLLTKVTAGIVAGAVMLTLAVSYVPRARFRWLIVAGIGGSVAVLGASLSWGTNAAHWYSDGPPEAGNRIQLALGPHPAEGTLGRSVLKLGADGESAPRSVVQELAWSKGAALRGRTVSFGAWLRTEDETGGTVVLDLDDGITDHWNLVRVNGSWTFHAYTATVASNAPGIALRLLLPEREDRAGSVLADGILLVDRERPVETLPSFDNALAMRGQWGSSHFDNLLENGSAERGWPGPRAWIREVRISAGSLTSAMQSLLEVRRTGWVYRHEIPLLFRSFWAGFSWNQISLPATLSYPLAALTLASVGGSAFWVMRCLSRGSRGTPGQRRAWVGVVVSLVVAWAITLLRIHPVFATGRIFWPVARYGSVAIVPTALVLCGGLAAFVPVRWQRTAAAFGLISLAGLDALALAAVLLPYYYG